MEILLELIFEVFLQIVLEVLSEVGLQSVGEAFRKREERSPVFAAIGYAIMGVVLGGLSLLVFPHPFARSQRLHGISLILAPLAGGAVMSLVGFLRRRSGKELLRLDSFLFGAIFSFGIASIRFFFAR